MANTFSWIGTTGDWTAAANWFDVTSATPGPPTAADIAAINSGQANVNPGDNVSVGGFGVGNSADAKLAITGGVLSATSAASVVGNNAGGNGTVTISAGGQLRFTAPPSANTVLFVGLNGPSATLPGAQGSVLVTGAGSLLDTGGSSMSIGVNAGTTGSLLVEQGGSVVTGSPDSNLIFALAVANGGGTGNVTLTDAGSTLTANGFSFIGRGGAGSLVIKNSATMVVNDAPLNGGGLSIGAGRGAGPVAPANAGGTGTAVVTTGGVLNIASTTSGITVGGNGVDGVLRVTNGGTVLTGIGMTVGTATFVLGTLYGGTGALDIGAGGVVKVGVPATDTRFAVEIGTANANVGLATADASGSVLVSGAGALLDTNGGGMEVGRAAAGSLSVSQGGSVAAGTPNSSVLPAISVGRFASGSVTISDPGSTVTATGGVNVGRAGTGTLLIENGGRFVSVLDATGVAAINIGFGNGSGSTSFMIGGSGSALVTSGGTLFSTQGVGVGLYGVAGQLTVENGGTVEAGSRLFIGNSVSVAAGSTIFAVSGTTIATTGTILGGTGVVNVGAGGTLKADGGALAVGSPVVEIGLGAGASGSLNVNGVGALVTAAGEMDVGDLGTGALLVANQGTVEAGSLINPAGIFEIAAGAGSSGSVRVTGAGALLANTGGFIVGDHAVGSLSIENAGTVTTTPTAPLVGTGADIAAHAGSDGSSVSVIGAGSNWQIGGSLMVGDAAFGVLSVAAGGAVTATSADLGVQAGSGANVAVTGAASHLTLAGPFGGQLTVGDAASAELSILNGATVSAQNADIGLLANATGNVDIEGAGSHLNIANNLNIGDAGTGVLTLGNATELTVVNALNVGAGGVLNQFGGLIDPAVINNTGRVGGKGAIIATTSILNTGTLFASGGTETLTSPVITGAGALEIDAGGDLVLNVGSVAATQTATFTDGTGILTLGSVAGFAATIGTFNTGDTILVTDPLVASDSFDPTTHRVTLFDASSTAVGTVQFTSAITTPPNVVLAPTPPPCFASGTRISTERGEVAVEQLCIGDRVQLAQGGAALPVIWLGHRSIDCTRHPAPGKVWPVRIAAHAFGPGRPGRDVYLSPDHAVLVGDVLIPVKHLINDTTIAQAAWDEVTYYHVELPKHAVLLSEGLPTESYLDTGDRANFANGGGPIALYPDFSSRVWHAEGCAPLVVTGAELAAARHWINLLAGVARAA